MLPGGLSDFSIEKVYSGLSEAMTFADFSAVAQAIRSACRDPDVAGVVVAHGTDTMEESAFYAELMHDRSKAVVFTGAQRSPGAADYDGPRNLKDAITLALQPESPDHGVLIAFGGLVIPASQAVKVHLTRLPGFSARDGNSGTIEGNVVEFPQRAGRFPYFEVGPVQETVVLITLSAGMSGKLIDAAVSAGYRGIVLAGLGAGNAPDAVCHAVKRAIDAGIEVIIGTRCAGGDVDTAYASGRALEDLGVTVARSLPLPQARILLSASLAFDDDRRIAKSSGDLLNR